MKGGTRDAPVVGDMLFVHGGDCQGNIVGKLCSFPQQPETQSSGNHCSRRGARRRDRGGAWD
eukprot:gene13312-biopygen525